MSYPIASRERAGLMPPELVEQVQQAYGSISALPPIGAILDYKGNLPNVGARWKPADRAVLQRASYPDLFNNLGWQFFLTGPTLTTLPADLAGTTPAAFATVNGRTYVGLRAGTQAGLYELGGYSGAYARPGAVGASGYVGILAHPQGRLNQMAYAGGYYAALRYSNVAAEQLFTSSDGTNFTQYAGGIVGSAYVAAIAGSGTNWIAINTASNFVHTRAGADPAGGWGSYVAGLTGVVQEVTWDATAGLYILGCTSGNIYTSATGLNGSWTSRMSTGQAADSIVHIKRFGGHLFAWGASTNTGIFRSSDGITWTNIRPVSVPVVHKFYFDGARHYIMDATNNVMYVSNDGFTTFYIMPMALFPFTFGANVSPHWNPATNDIWIGNPSGITTVSGMRAIYDYGTQFALPPSDAGRKQIVRVL